jgi:hypothetical protein
MDPEWSVKMNDVGLDFSEELPEFLDAVRHALPGCHPRRGPRRHGETNERDALEGRAAGPLGEVGSDGVDAATVQGDMEPVDVELGATHDFVGVVLA